MPEQNITTRLEWQLRGEDRIRRYKRRNEELAAVIEDLRKTFRKFDKDVGATDKSIKTQMLRIREWRWEIITVMFFARTLGRVISTAFEEASNATERSLQRMVLTEVVESYDRDTKELVNSLRRVSEGALTHTQAFQAVQAGLIEDQGQFADYYAQFWQIAELAALTSGEEIIDVFGKIVSAIDDANDKALDAATPYVDVQKAVEDYATSVGKTVKELSDQERMQAAVNAVVARTNELLGREAVQAALEQQRALQKLKGTWEDFKEVLIGAVAGKPLERLSDLTGLLEKATAWTIKLGAAAAAYQEIWSRSRLPEGLQGIGPLGQALGLGVGAAKTLLGGENIGEVISEAYQKRFEELNEVIGDFEDSVDSAADKAIDLSGAYDDSAGKIERNFSSLINHILRYDQILEQHSKNVEKIYARYRDNIQDAEESFQNRLFDIRLGAERDRARAIRRHNDRLRRTQEDYYRDDQKRLEKYLLNKQQTIEKYNLRRIQNERQYEYERGRLVARGDVLAIEELDAQYEMQKQAQEENLDLQLKNMRENFDLENKYAKEAQNQRLRDLKQSLDEQLREISIREQERIKDAERRRQQDLVKAKKKLDQQLADEEEAHQESLQQWYDHWAAVARQTELGADAVTKIVEGYFGKDGPADAILKAYSARAQEYLNIEKFLRGMTFSGGSSIVIEKKHVKIPKGSKSNIYAMAEGGDYMVRKPTLFLAGESGPERATFMPLGKGIPQDAGVPLYWQGGPIPLEVENADTGERQTTNVSGELMQSVLQVLSEQIRGAR